MKINAICFMASVLLCLITSCTFNSSYINEEAERAKAEKVTDNMYSFIKDNKFTAAEKLFSDKFFNVTNRAGLETIFKKTAETLGNYKYKKLIDWKTNRVEGSNAGADYLLIYEVTYDKYKAQETIRLIKEGSSIRIIAYNINSDGFLK